MLFIILLKFLARSAISCLLAEFCNIHFSMWLLTPDVVGHLLGNDH